MAAIDRRGFIAAGAGAFFALSCGRAPAAITDGKNPLDRRKRIDAKKPIEDNLINEYLQPKRISLNVGAAKPFSALHFSDTHVCMMDAADLLSGKSKELSLWEARNHGVFGNGGFPFSLPSLAATIAYARRKNIPMLNTGDVFDFRSEANIACIARSFKGQDVFSALGNHEGHGLHSPGANPRTPSEENALLGRYEQAFGQPLTVASRVINGVNFVAFDNCEMARFSRDRQLRMLEEEFAKGLPTVAMCHMPPCSKELHEATCALHKSRGKKPPDGKHLRGYYMMGEDFAETKASEGLAKIVKFLRARKNLKAILCGHLHYEWQGEFGDGVPVVVAGRNFNGECYEISFT